MCRQPLALVSSLKTRRETIMKRKEVEEDNEKASKVEKEEECDEY